ncbi:MAG TPA: protein kinase [Gemmataceae bacterium]|nr:protein kinase [Gemmataceae bacterium]
MPAKVTLKVVEGQLEGQEFVFADRNSCILGRAEDCNPRLPNDADHKTISRHHCLLDINPPDVRIRDFGSRNGTFVNGEKIGQRTAGMSPQEAASMTFPERDLKTGDKVKLGKTVLEVAVFAPAICIDCEAEIPEQQKPQTPIAKIAGDVLRCESCRRKAESSPPKEAIRTKPKRCVKCSRDVSAEMGENRHGELLCAACRADPLDVIKLLLSRAKSGDRSLLAIEGYSVQKELGKGGMGAVYLARHDRTGEQVALKVMLPKVALDERSKKAFLDETAHTKALDHPNVVKLREYGCSQGTFFFTMEFCNAGSIDRLMEKNGGVLAAAEAGPLVLQALAGLEYAHEVDLSDRHGTYGARRSARGLVHRDLKPHNIFLNDSAGGHVAKIGDFGLAKAFDNAGLSGRTRTGEMAGTPLFMPRQQVINFKYSQPEVDVWAIAASLYYMLTGSPPRDFARGRDPWFTVLQSDAIPIRKRQPSIPKTLADVIDLALIDNPSIRFKSAAAFRRALEAVL